MKAREKQIDLSNGSVIMGILNITEDSFSGDGIMDPITAVGYALNMVKNGASIIDIGGESSKPGALPISEDEELKRVIPIVTELAKYSIIVSVDTYKPRVAEKALEHGAHIINDIKGLRDPDIAKVVAKYNAGLVIMHMQGDPNTMQINPQYNDVIKEISEFFEEKINIAKSLGVNEENIILDPGIGFGKTLENNIEILRNISTFKNRFHKPILIGTSRKSFLGKIIGKEIPKDRIFGNAAATTFSIMNGADILRVHDVPEMLDVVKVTNALKFSK